MSVFLIAQIIGFIAVLVSISIFQVNNRKMMLRLGMLASIIYAVHFLLIGAFTGSAMNLVAATRSYVFYRVLPDRKHRSVLYLFILIAILATIVTWQGLMSLLPLTAIIFGGIALWHKKPKSIRRWALIVPLLWFAYNFMSGSYPGMIIEVIMFSSNLIGEYRYDWHHKKHVRRRLAKPT